MKKNPFPIDVFPKELADYCIELADAINVNVSVVACCILPILATAIGLTRKVKIKSGHIEPCMIWTVIVAKSGYGKTPVLRALLKPFYDEEKEMRRKYNDAMKIYNESTDKDKMAKPVKKSLIVSDATIEALAKIIEENPLGVLFYRDEISGLIGSLGKYNKSKGSDEASILEIFNGDPIKVSRKGEGLSVHTENSNLSIVGGIQPSVFKEIFDSKDWTSGLVARFLIFPETGKASGYSAKTVSEKVELGYLDTIFSLFKLRSGYSKTKVIEYDKQSLNLFIEWSNGFITPKINKAGEALSASLSKMGTYVHRIALVLQCCTNSHATQIKVDVIKNAIRVVEWFIGNLEPFQNEVVDDTDNILRIIKNKNGFITPRELSKSIRSFANTSQARRRLLELTRDEKLKMLRRDGEFGFEMAS